MTFEVSEHVKYEYLSILQIAGILRINLRFSFIAILSFWVIGIQIV